MDEKTVLNIVSHTHWDREWYFSFQQFRHRLVKLMDHLLDLLERDPRYKYFTLDGQTLALEDYLGIRPEREPDLRKVISEGRLLIGPWYTQPNEFMSSGESMIRNLLLGFRECERYGGIMRVCYLPDAFGHISQLPQIMQGFGINDIVAWRGMPAETRLVSEWTGADGSKCKFFYLYGSYGLALDLPLVDEEVTLSIDSTPLDAPFPFRQDAFEPHIRKLASFLQPRATSPYLLLMNGVDHTFAQANLPDVIDKINRTMPDMAAQHSTFEQHIQAVTDYHEKHNVAYDQLSGEIHDSIEGIVLVDSQSTRAPVKLTNDRIERLFERWMEPFAAYAWLLGVPYPQAEIWQGWKYLLENHAHDSLACSSLDSTYHQVMTRYEWAEELGNELVSDSLQAICSVQAVGQQEARPNLVLVFNPLNWARSGVFTTTLDVPKALNLGSPRLFDGDQEVPLAINQVSEDTVVHYNPRRGLTHAVPVQRYELSFVTPEVPGCGYRTYRLAGAARDQALVGGLLARPNILENEHFRLRVNGDSTLDLMDKRTGREYPSLHIFEDCGEAGHGFHHDAPQRDTVIYSLGAAARISVVEDSPWAAALQATLTLDLPVALNPSRTARLEETAPCTISSTIRLTAGSPRVDIETTVDNRSRDHRLRVTFPTGLRADVSHAAQPFDVVTRPVKLPDLNAYPDERQSPVNPLGGFVDVSDGQAGLMVASQGLYEYEVTDRPDRSICVTLLRCLQKLHPGPFWDCDAMQLHEAQCLGTTTFRYSIIPHADGWEAAVRDAYEFRFPMRAVRAIPPEEATLVDYQPLTVPGGLAAVHSFLQVEPDTFLVTAVKKAEDRRSLIVRVFNPSPEPAACRIKAVAPGFAPVRAHRTNLNEERQEQLPLDESGWVQCAIHGKGLLTVELER